MFVTHLQPVPEKVGEKLEEEITMTRLYVSRIKSEVKQLATKCSNFKTLQEESNKKLEESEQELAASQLLIQQVSTFDIQFVCFYLLVTWYCCCIEIRFLRIFSLLIAGCMWCWTWSFTRFVLKLFSSRCFKLLITSLSTLWRSSYEIGIGHKYSTVF